jgi:hypothetical protein
MFRISLIGIPYVLLNPTQREVFLKNYFCLKLKIYLFVCKNLATCIQISNYELVVLLNLLIQACMK